MKLRQNQITITLNSQPYTDINAITSIIDEDIPLKLSPLQKQYTVLPPVEEYNHRPPTAAVAPPPPPAQPPATPLHHLHRQHMHGSVIPTTTQHPAKQTTSSSQIISVEQMDQGHGTPVLEILSPTPIAMESLLPLPHRPLETYSSHQTRKSSFSQAHNAVHQIVASLDLGHPPTTASPPPAIQSSSLNSKCHGTRHLALILICRQFGSSMLKSHERYNMEMHNVVVGQLAVVNSMPLKFCQQEVTF